MAVWCAAMIPLGGCIFAFRDFDDDGSDGEPNSGKILVRMINASLSFGVDPELYATGQAVTNLNTDLFVDANKKGGFGDYGTGLLDPGQDAQIEIDCGAARVVGTRGGRFLKRSTGEVVATGQQRVVSQELQFDCGDVITITYEGKGPNEATTAIAVSRP